MKLKNWNEEKEGGMEEKRFDYHEPEELKQYLDSWGRIKSQRKTGLTAEEHRRMVKAVKRARHLALL